MNVEAEVEAAHNLPSRLTSFVGREREIGEVEALLGSHRLVTLVGAPGVGKTRLGLQIAANLLDRFPDGVWLVELAPLSDPELVPHAVADVLGVQEQPGLTLTATLAGYLRTRRLLLVVDNCEHLIAAVAALAETLLQAHSALRILATSREPLAIEGELAHRVPTLPDAEAVRLFVERARVASPSFALTDRTTPIVGQICARLDGIPLALELAAARVRALSVEQIADRLDDRFRLLIGGSRTALPRLQTLRGAVDWSYDLLSGPEQRLLRRLSVFAGGFTLDAAETAENWILGSGQEPATSSSPRTQTLEPNTLIGLVDKSLVQIDDGTEDGERRYRLLETFREYGQEKLIEHGELDDARHRHRDYVLAFAEEVAPALNERSERTILTRMELEHDNLRVALAWCLEEPGTGRGGPAVGEDDRRPTGAALGVRLAAAIWRFWWLRGHLGEGRRWLARALAVPASDTSPSGLAARATAFLGLSQLSAHQGDYRAAVAHMTENLAFCRATGNDRGVVWALHRLGFYLAHLGETDRPLQLCEESVALGRRVGDPVALAPALLSAGMVARMSGRPEQSVILSDEAIDLHRELGNLTNMAYAISSKSHAVADLGDLAKGQALAEEGLRISQQVGDKRGIAMAFKDLGRLALFAGDADGAIEPLHAALALLQPLGDRWLSSICLEILAGVVLARAVSSPGVVVESPSETGRTDASLLDAVRLYAWADLLRTQTGLNPPPEMHGTPEQNVALLRERLGEAAFAQAWAEGRAMSFEDVTEYALVLAASADTASPEVPTPPQDTMDDENPEPAPLSRFAGEGALSSEAARLTAREREVAALVARGRTNRQIAEALVLSERTVHTHVHNILGKLELTSRAQIAVWAVEHGMAVSQ